MLSELESNILNDNAIQILVKKINKHIQEQSKNEKSSTKIIVKELEDIDKQINNIVNTITQEFAYDEFKTKLDNLKGRKTKLEVTLIELENGSKAPNIKE